MRVGILGPLVVLDGDRPIPLGGAKERAVLATLALDAGRVVPIDRLVDVVWPGEPPRTAVKTVQNYVLRLRKRLAPLLAIETVTRGYLLRGGPDTTDVGVVARLRAEADSAARSGDTSRRLACLQEALALWRGRSLSEFLALPALASEAARLDELRTVLREDAMDAELAAGRHQELVAELESQVAANPLRERLWTQLMLALYRSGRQADALNAYRRARTVLVEQLGLEPSPQLRALERSILEQDPSLGAPVPGAPRSPLPQTVTSLIGRQDDVDEVLELVSDSPLVTLTGVGGIGKTRMALAVGEAWLRATGRPVWLVELAPLDNGAAVAATVAASVSPATTSDDPIEVIVSALDRQPGLLILDNCEHVIDQACALADALLRRSRGVRVLATSRERLAINGERVWPVPALAAPDASSLTGADDPSEIPSVLLFCERALSATPGLTFDRAALLRVAEVCHRLDGVPLALELAAAQLPVLSLDELMTRLDDPFSVLGGGGRTSLPQHRTLQAAMDWSHGLLDAPARLVFRRLSVFPGAFSLADAEAVCVDRSLAPALVFPVLSVLQGLVNKSLVTVDGALGERRFRMLQTMRDYARVQLDRAGETAETRRRHLRQLLAVADMSLPAKYAEVDRVAGYLADIRAAVDWGLASGEAILVTELLTSAWGYLRSGAPHEGRQWLQRAVNTEPRSTGVGRARALMALAHLRLQGYELELAREAAEEAFRIASRLDDRLVLSQALFTMARPAHLGDDPSTALHWYERSLAVAQAAKNTYLTARTMYFLGVLLTDQGQYDRGIRLLDSAAVAYSSFGSADEASVLSSRGLVAYRLRDLETAADTLGRAVRLFRSFGYAPSLCEPLHRHAHVLRCLGDRQGARAAATESLTIGEAVGARGDTILARHALAELALDEDRLADAASELSQGLASVTGTDDRWILIELVEAGVRLAAAVSAWSFVARLLGAADGLREAILFAHEPVKAADLDGARGLALASLGGAAYSAAYLAGQRLGARGAASLLRDLLEDAAPLAGISSTG
ncbi:BTAD domain-containing putative transcriptional regulator [Tenggerimyces flavus]|uniref:BTAD domain-containing putative transcriptional regulator n=1 Tax=Tenggerimyces flavus TaxID=1708749 RepID=A0ABV7YIB7_9ACTN|nr:BTAD domain-containing putative transcriptional regulator [Tenggerimyces flavus]MBM7789854.1 putative ATPase/DNA-binding SARP family transcriptional activator [Tenggerimyces flavus]